MKSILFIGPAPQNIGGISIHIRRLVSLLKDVYIADFIDEGHVRYDGVFNLRTKNIIKYLKKVISADIVHIHSGVWLLRAFHIVVCKLLLRKRVLVTIHRDPTIEPHIDLTKWLLSKCDHAILVNQKGYDSMYKPVKCQYHMLPAFLPPIMEDEPNLPYEIINWLDSARQNNGYVMCSNAWNLVLHNGEDLYGLDLCLDAMISLSSDVSNYYLIFVVATNTEQKDRMTSYKDKIQKSGLEGRILIWEQSTSFVRIVKKADLVLRTTNTDGDAISIREALYFGIPVLASDIVTRPEGSNLFKTRDVDDLIMQIRNVAAKYNNLTNKSRDYKRLYMEMYN